MFKPRSRFMAAALSAALALGMAPSFAALAPGDAYAAEGGALVSTQIAAQEDAGAGTVNWASVYGHDSGSGTDTFSSSLVNAFENATVLGDGSIVAAGADAVKASGKNSLDAALVYYDANGNQTAAKTFSSTMYDAFEKVIQTSDGNLIAVGYAGNGDGDFAGIVADKGANAKTSDFDAVILKLDAQGNLLKGVAFGGSGKDMFRDVVELDDGSFIVVGYASSADGDMQDKSETDTRDALVMRFSADLSEHSIVDILGGTAGGMEEARAVVKGIGGGYAVAGTGFSNDGDFQGVYKSETNNRGDWFLASYDAEGARTGLAMYGGAEHDYLMGIDYDYLDADHVAQQSPTGYVLVGYGKSADGDFAGIGNGENDCAALMRVAADGTLREAVPVGSAEKSYAEDVLSSPAGYLVAGRFAGTLSAGEASIDSQGGEDVSTAFIARNGSAYAYSPVKAFGGGGVDRARSIAIDANENVLVTGTTQSDTFMGAQVDDKSRAFALSVPANAVMPEGAYAAQKAVEDKAKSLAALNAAIANADAASCGHATFEQWCALQAALAQAKAIDQATADAAQATAAADALKAARAAVDDANATPVALPEQDGDYALTATAYSESKFRTAAPSEFNLGRQFDPNMKLTKAGDSLKLEMLYTSSIDMQKVSIDGIEAEKAGYGPKNAGDAGTYGMYLFTITLPADFDLNADHKLSFSYDTGNPRMGVMTHSVYLANLGTAAWNGFSSVAAQLGSAATPYRAGTYAIPAKLMNAASDNASMAAGAFNENAFLTIVADGTATVEIGTKPLTFGGITAYADNVKVYQAASASGDLVAAEEASTKVIAVNGADYTVPTTLKFAVPQAALQQDSVYVSLEAPGSPMPAAVNARLQFDYAQLADMTSAQVERAAALIGWLGDDVTLDDAAAVAAAQA
ncbi:MAG TPA: hypothetical protein DCP91_12800, partial [Eggerthellaceae bacterium]|nr:hypothetical protein [Eggerthellaceae bacterium]